jgi:hypothetical protein
MGASPEVSIPDAERGKESFGADTSSGGGFGDYLVGKIL